MCGCHRGEPGPLRTRPLPAEIQGFAAPQLHLLTVPGNCRRLSGALSASQGLWLIPSSNFLQLLTSVLIVGLSFVWLTLALPDGNFVLVPSIQEGNCLCHSFFLKEKFCCMVDLHCCVNFCRKAKLLSYTCIFFFIFFSFMIFHRILNRSFMLCNRILLFSNPLYNGLCLLIPNSQYSIPTLHPLELQVCSLRLRVCFCSVDVFICVIV